jgi:hypothetical protein
VTAASSLDDRFKDASSEASTKSIETSPLLQRSSQNGNHFKPNNKAVNPLQARTALETGETPVGCVFVHSNKIIGTGMNQTNKSRSVLSFKVLTNAGNPSR